MGDTNDTQRIHFRNLDVLRFIAAYMIVLLHCFFGWKVKFGNPTFLTPTLSPTSLDKLELIMHNLSFGVDVFFIISGFLLTYLLLHEREKNGKVDVIKFYIRRAFRIWPLYFFMILLAPVLVYFFNEQSPSYGLHFTFLGNFDLINVGPTSVATNHLWSICIEEHFYLFCPLLIGFIPLRKLPEVLLTIILACIVFRGYFLASTADYGMAYYVHTLSRIDVLCLGSLFGYLFYYKKLTFNHSLPIRFVIYSCFILLFLNVNYVDSGNFLIDTMKKYLYVIPCAYWMGNFLFNPAAVFPMQKPNILLHFGKASYGIYMFNPVVIFLLIQLFAKYNWQNYFLFLAIVHVLLAAVTYLSYKYFELPFLALKEKYAVIKSGDPGKDKEKENEVEPVLEIIQQETIPINTGNNNPIP